MTTSGAPPKAPLVFLALLSIVAFAGPFVIFLTLRGGRSPEWPPDRIVEWVALVGVTVMLLVLLTGCLTSGIWARSSTKR